MTQVNKPSQKKLLYVLVGLVIVIGIFFFIKQHAQTSSSLNNTKPVVWPKAQPLKNDGEHEDIKDQPLKIIGITSNGFSPDTVTIKVKTVIALSNKDKKEHVVVTDSADGSQTITVKPGEQVTAARYEKPGTYTYHFKDTNQSLTIIVENQ
jgi:plastocyanin